MTLELFSKTVRWPSLAGVRAWSGLSMTNTSYRKSTARVRDPLLQTLSLLILVHSAHLSKPSPQIPRGLISLREFISSQLTFITFSF